MSARDLAGLVAPGRNSPPERTVAAPPPRRRAAASTTSHADQVPPASAPARQDSQPGPAAVPPRNRRTKPQPDDLNGTRQNDVRKPTASTTVRISVNIPLACKEWLARQARQQQRFVSEIVMEALDRHGDDASPPTGRAKRVAVPDGTIYNIVLPSQDRQRLDDIVARKQSTRSALLSEILRRAVDA